MAQDDRLRPAVIENHSQRFPELPVDPGCLPAWEVDDLPEAQPPNYAKWWLLIGPGLVMAGGSIGTGEWVMGAKTAAQYQGALFFVVILSIFGQVMLNTEAMRYTLATGEPMLTGFLRTKPGPRFWLLFYMVLDFGSWLPSLSALAAQIILIAIKGMGPSDVMTDDLVNQVRMISYFVFVGCATMVLFGGKIYNTLEVVLGGKFIFVLVYLSFCCFMFVPWNIWFQMWSGLFDIRPERIMSGGEIDWTLISALAGFSGIGGLGNIVASNFVREKGWGMGGKVGAIPSAFGGHQIKLSHIGTICRGGAETKRRFAVWWKYLVVDQYFLWAIGSLIGMMLPSMLGAAFLDPRPGEALNDWQWAAALAQDFGEAKGPIFRWLTLFCGLIIFIPGQFYVVDTVSRRWCDAIWSGTEMARRMEPGQVRYLYYGIATLYVLWGVTALTVFSKLSGAGMMKIAGNMANLSIATAILHAWYVNCRFLPVELRPSLLKRLGMACSAGFFLSMFGLVFNQKILPLVIDAPLRAGAAIGVVLTLMVLMALRERALVTRQRREWGVDTV